MTDPGLWLRGFVRIRAECADPAAFRDRCVRKGVLLRDVTAENGLTLAFTVSRRDLPAVRSVLERLGCRWETTSRRGLPEALRRAWRNRLPLLLTAAAALALAAASLLVWDVQVTENDSAVSDVKILRVLEEQGVGPGSFWPSFRSERIRTRALLELPELSFLTVNVRGGRACVEVRAALPPPEIFDPDRPGSVVAGRSGIVHSVLALSGTPQVRRGDAVTERQVLIASDDTSPHAAGEVRAYTYREQTAGVPLTSRILVPEGTVHRRFALILGRKRINFYAGSGILPAGCVKMTREWAFRAEKAFSLPVKWISETWRTCSLREEDRNISDLREKLEDRLTERLTSSLGDRGEILERRFTAAVTDGWLLVTMRSKCLERIDVDAPA